MTGRSAADEVTGTVHEQGVRWLRGLSRALLLIVGAIQCLLGVIFGVSLLASAFIYAGDGPGLALSSIALLVLDLALFVAGLFALLGALEEWDPPQNRWQGIRWPVLGLAGGLVTVLSWILVVGLIWSP